MSAPEIVPSVTIQHTVAARVAIVQGSVGRVGVLVNGQILPLGNVLLGNARIVGSVGCVTRLVGNDSHSLDTNHALQGQVGLVANSTGQYLLKRDGLVQLTPEIQQSHRLRFGWLGTGHPR